ncbi:MAG TPA: TIGR01777 family protein [Nitrospirae bacterium]|nr:TIGR01777 family protein [Nitrospirota bacterium]HDL20364.1 TIGR01777 family protein [Nitrospirota bacterium]HDZ01239.1 TIGR01777 family protein [Nitrospirota bacterium]
MRILITGGTGFIGSALNRDLRSAGHNVIISTRRRTASKGMLSWNPPELIPGDIISNIDAVINLAGESIASGRWTKTRKALIMSSRINTTRALVQSIQDANPKPKVFISASAIGYYGPHEDESVTEAAPPGSDFLAEVCKAWEAEALKAEGLGVRVVTVRIGAVLEADGGALPQMIIPFKLFLGGPIGSGKQWFSWIHRDDMAGIIKHALEDDSITGPLNAVAPNPVTNKEFSKALGKALHRPSCLAVPGFVVKLALGELGDMLLTGQRVLPEKALKSGYKFKYPEVDEALRAIFR